MQNSFSKSNQMYRPNISVASKKVCSPALPSTLQIIALLVIFYSRRGMNSILSNDASQIWTCKNRFLFLHSNAESLKIKWRITGINCEALYICFVSNNRVIANSESFSPVLHKLDVTFVDRALLSLNIPKKEWMPV